jgi:hypothetical protein
VVRDKDNPGLARISGQRPGGWRFSQHDSTWVTSGFFLQWTNLTRSSSKEWQVTLICFGAPKQVRTRLVQLESWTEALRDPLALLVLVLDELSAQMDATVWDVFRRLEFVRAEPKLPAPKHIIAPYERY